MKNISKLIPVAYFKAHKDDGTLAWGEECVSATNDFEEDDYMGVALVRLSDVADLSEVECENCNQLVRALREAVEGPTFMGEPVFKPPSGAAVKEEPNPLIPWNGTDKSYDGPLPPGSMADLKFRDGQVMCGCKAWEYNWRDRGEEDDIVAYRLTTPQPPTAEPVDPAYPFYELKFIMRVLSHKGGAPKQDWDTAYGMAREIFVRWHKDRQATAEGQTNEQGRAADGAVSGAPSGGEVLRQLTALCEATEELPIDEKLKGTKAFDFKRGQSFEAKQIRRTMNIWFQDERNTTQPPSAGPVAVPLNMGDIVRQYSIQTGDCYRFSDTNLTQFVKAILTQPTHTRADELSGLEYTNEQIVELCKAAGIVWIEPMPATEGWGDTPAFDAHPGGFDICSMEEMRKLLSHSPYVESFFRRFVHFFLGSGAHRAESFHRAAINFANEAKKFLKEPSA